MGLVFWECLGMRGFLRWNRMENGMEPAARVSLPTAAQQGKDAKTA